MTGDVERRAEVRISNMDRERLIEHLQRCTGEGRLDLDEFAARVDRVYAAKTFGDLEPITADLPALAEAAPAPAVMEIKNTASSVKRAGRWVVPRRLVVRSKAGSVRLDLTEAVLPYGEVDVDMDLTGASLTMILPAGATVDDQDLDLTASSCTNRVADTGEARRLSVRLHGSLRGSSLTARCRRRFLWWTF